jgi:hypothetical protein
MTEPRRKHPFDCARAIRRERDIGYWVLRIDEAAALTAAREALEKYGSHQFPCNSRGCQCTCGLDSALAGHEL